MATTPKRLALVNITASTLTPLYTAASGINTSASVLEFTNNADTTIQIDIYQNDGTSDFLKRRLTLPAGVGKVRYYDGFQRQVLNAGDAIKIQALTASDFNVGLFGREVEI